MPSLVPPGTPSARKSLALVETFPRPAPLIQRSGQWCPPPPSPKTPDVTEAAASNARQCSERLLVFPDGQRLMREGVTSAPRGPQFPDGGFFKFLSPAFERVIPDEQEPTDPGAGSGHRSGRSN